MQLKLLENVTLYIEAEKLFANVYHAPTQSRVDQEQSKNRILTSLAEHISVQRTPFLSYPSVLHFCTFLLLCFSSHQPLLTTHACHRYQLSVNSA